MIKIYCYFVIVLSTFINFLDCKGYGYETSHEINIYGSYRHLNQENLSQKEDNLFSTALWAASTFKFYPAELVNFEIRPELRYLRDEGISLKKNDPAAATIAPTERLFPLEWQLKKEKKDESSLSIERVKLSIQNNQFEIHVGRRPISLGTLRIFPVWNKFSKISPTSFAAPQIIATQDGFSLRQQSDLGVLQVVGVLDKESRKNAYLSELVLFYETLELHALVGNWWDARALGFGVSKDVGGLNIKGETLYIPSGENLDHQILQIGLGGEYAFSAALSGVFELFYESNGHSNKNDYQVNLLDRFSFLQSTAYSFLQFFWKTTPTLTLSQGLLQNVLDQSTLVLSKIEYSYSENMDLTFALSSPFGSKGSEFSKETFHFYPDKKLGMPTIVSLTSKIYF